MEHAVPIGNEFPTLESFKNRLSFMRKYLQEFKHSSKTLV